MKYLLAVAILFTILSLLAYRSSERAPADEGIAAAVVSGLLAIVAGVCGMIYVGMVFWYHQFW